MQTYYCNSIATYLICFKLLRRQNRWKKRGLAIVPTKYGVAFGRTFLNQSGALVNVYTDGSVLVTHGGMEMGQGLHTNMMQVAARCLDVPVEKVHILETTTQIVPNTSPTAASVSCDLNGMAIKVPVTHILSGSDLAVML